MEKIKVEFPGLGLSFDVNDVAFSIGGLDIKWYGLLIGFALLLCTILAMKQSKKNKFSDDLVSEIILVGIPSAIIGARLYYVAFSWDYYKDDLFSIFKIREGGLAIYGGVIGAYITMFVYSRIKKLSMPQIGDTCMPGLVLGQVIGRWGNFMNREAFGEYTDSLFAMRLPIEEVRRRDVTEQMREHVTEGINYIQVHPTFLYESVWNLVLLVIMLSYHKHKKFQGEICLLYLGGYGLGRFLIEGLRTDQLMIPGTSVAVSQMLSLCLFVFSLIMDLIMRRRIKSGKMEAYVFPDVSTDGEKTMEKDK